MNSFIPTLIFFLLFTTNLIYGNDDVTNDKKYYVGTRKNEIVRWQDTKKSQYVIGYGLDETNTLTPYAIYDKTMPEIVPFSFWQNLILSTLGINDINISNINKNLENKKSKKKVERYLGKKLIKIILMTQKKSSRSQLFYPNWWKSPNIQWKKGLKPDLNSPAPEIIPLNNIDFILSKEQEKILQQIERLIVKYNAPFDGNEQTGSHPSIQKLKSVKDLIHNGNFILQKEGYYKFVYQTNKKNPPVKIVDLKNKDSSFKRAILWGASTSAVKVAISHVPLYGIAQTIVAFLERAFNLIEVLFLIKHAEALNAIVEAKNKNPASPFYELLDEEKLNDAIRYLKRSRTMISYILINSFSKRSNIASNHMNQYNKRIEKYKSILEKKKYTIYPFEKSSYCLGMKKNDKDEIIELKIFSLTRSRAFKSTPLDVVDFLNPTKEIIKRNILEAILFGTSYIVTPIPFVHTIVKILYKEAVIRRVHRYQMDEASFKSHLRYNKKKIIEIFKQAGFSKEKSINMYNLAYKQIERRELNPLCPTKEEEKKNIIKRENWLKNQSVEYIQIEK